MDSPLIRGVRLDDLSRLAELEQKAFEDIGWPLFVLRQTHDIIGSWWVLVEHDDEIWGHVLSAFQGDDKTVAWILGVAVHPERQGRGYGELLMLAALDLLWANGADVIRLAVEPENVQARGLYDKLGFLDHNVIIEDYFGPGMHRKILTLLLPARPRFGSPPVLPGNPADEEDEEDEEAAEDSGPLPGRQDGANGPAAYAGPRAWGPDGLGVPEGPKASIPCQRTGDGLFIRHMLRADLPRIAVLEATASGERAMRLPDLRRWFAAFGSLWLVAEDEEGVWGYSLSAPAAEDRTVFWMTGLTVHPDRQGRGWARALLEASSLRLQAAGARRIHLTVEPDNAQALALCRSFGFGQEAGHADDPCDPGEDRVFLSKPLSVNPEVPVDS